MIESLHNILMRSEVAGEFKGNNRGKPKYPEL